MKINRGLCARDKYIKYLKKRSDRLRIIENLIDDEVIRLYIQPGDNFNEFVNLKGLRGERNSVSAMASMSKEKFINALTRDPIGLVNFMVDELIDKKEKTVINNTKKEQSRPKRNEQMTNVYLMRNERNGYTKIGMTNGKPRYRERTLQSQEPEVSLMFAFRSKASTEFELHERYASKRLRGEWFDLSESDISEIIDEFKEFSVSFD